ncbi:MAG: Uma2 family endonuclease [Acidobacteria bacterium]|nr:Uma2 family endonuclease [Acidobacteriota bacterium]
MPAASASPVQRIELWGRSWESYQAFLALQQERSPRISFDDGWLEVMVCSIEHEEPSQTLAAIVATVAEEAGIDFEPAGRPTIQRAHLKKGFEPDAAFYFTHLDRMRKPRFKPNELPAPDLTIEVDLTSDSRPRLGIFAAVGVPEVWRFSNGDLEFLTLLDGAYRPATRSQWLPSLTAKTVMRWLKQREQMSRLAWLKSIRTWTRRNAG